MADQPSKPPATASPKGPTASAMRDELQSRQGGNDDVEVDMWSGGYSPKAMLGTWLGTGLLSILAIIGAALYASNYIGWVLMAVLVAWVLVGCLYGYRRMGVHYELTSQRFIHQSGVLSRRTDRIEVIDIDDVTFKQGPVQRMLGVGTIIIESSDRSHPKLEMIGIANVRDVAGLIDDIRRKERRRRSLHIEAI
jgi:uncharacterized membrane protein YdbT with pleckstrin-like domain